MKKLLLLVLVGGCFLASGHANESPLSPLEVIPSPLATVPAKVATNAVWGDRVVYAPNDPHAQVLVVSHALAKAPAGTKLGISIIDAAGVEKDRREFAVADGQPAYLVAGKMDVSLLKTGSYSLQGVITYADGTPSVSLVTSPFSVDAQPRAVAKFPADGVALRVAETGAPGATTAPLAFGVPLPFGAVGSGEAFEVWEDGRPILTQSRPLALWGPGPEQSVRWMGVSFLAKYQDGKARDYRVKRSSAAQTAGLQLKETAETVEIDTGAVRFVLSKKQFRGPEQLVVTTPTGEVKVPAGKSPGAYVVDDKGRRYEAAADLEPEVRIEERGPVRAAVSVRGWYADPKDPSVKLCQYQVRIYAYAGLARIDGFQRTVVTYDTRAMKLADVGFSMPAVPSAKGDVEWMTGIDGVVKNGSAAAADEIYFAQASPDAVWLNRIDGEPTGKRSDGWLAVTAGNLTASGYLRDVWEKFPKEISASAGQLTFHTWPKHGRRVVKPEEEITRDSIHRNWFAHQGPLLDLQLPESYFNQLQEWNKTEMWDRENTAPIGYRSSGSGVSMSIRFGVEYFPSTTPAEATAAQSVANQSAPSATTDPQWNVASGVIPFITAAGDPRWERADALLEAFATGMKNLADAGHILGMWIYGNTNNNWDTTLKAPFLHRVWQNSHYGHASFPWKYYYRSADPRFLELARAQTGNLMDVGIVHYVRPEESGTYAGKAAGGLYHAKGWLPWGVRLRTEFRTDSDVGTLQHWTNPKVFLERYFAEVDLEALDVFQLWFDRLVNSYQYRPRYGVGRELTQSISELTDIYQSLWDPRLVGYLRPMGDSALGTPFRNYVSQLGFAFFNRTWPIRYHTFARDPKVLDRLEEAIPVTASHGPYGMASAAYLLSQRKQMERVPRLLNVVENADRNIFRNPGDPLDGFGSYASAVDSRTLDEIPSVLAALSVFKPAELDKLRESTVALDPVFPARSGRKQVRVGTEAALILAHNPDGRAFKVRFESRAGIDMLPAIARVVGPDGTSLVQVPLHEKQPDGKARSVRYLGAGAPVVAVPATTPGVYRIEFYGHYPVYRAPLTDLPREIAVLGQGCQAVNGFIYAPEAKQLTLGFAATKPQGSARPVNFVARNLDHEETFQTTLLFGSNRTSDSVTLTGGADGVRAEVRAANLIWEPAEQTAYFAHRLEDFAPLLRALGSQSTKLENATPKAPASEPAAPPEE